ncbi:DUF1735 and LamG domain-containing protein [Hoylesella buccalis]|uniref:DUF1735 and LamG domain-containing protein n=1 Tax=Hoylesella buccalis TaxID=28127 RepID=UPI00288C54C4|nr:DUF1735 and LamG domain-containing protein [Hoylesella buccalis]
MKKIFLKYMPFAAIAFLLAACQNNDEENFANKGFIDETSMLAETIIKGNVAPLTKTFHVALARPAQTAVSMTAHVNTALVSTYNQAYYTNAELLPDTCYRVDVDKMNIAEGAIKSTEAQFSFLNLGGLDRSKLYVLPVEIESNAVELLNTAKRYYFVFRAGALINTVADIEKNYLEISPWATPDRVSRMKEVTLEALIYPREFGKLISTVMGIEGTFLMRIGDAGVPDNQIQIATHNGNFTSAKLQLETNKWQHVAMTYSQTTQEMKVYINGRMMAETKMQCVPNLVGNGFDRNFLIGKSYDDNRWLSGCISEARVWDVVRTPEQIAGNIYTVDPKTQGLVAYWKFDDNSSLEVKDYTGNGNTLKANDKLKWKAVSLPEKK